MQRKRSLVGLTISPLGATSNISSANLRGINCGAFNLFGVLPVGTIAFRVTESGCSDISPRKISPIDKHK